MRSLFTGIVLCAGFVSSAFAGDVDADGRWVFIDPVTKTIAPQAPADELQAGVRDGIQGAEPRVIVMPNGLELLDTSHMLHMSTVTLHEDGELVSRCTNAQHAHPDPQP